MIGTALIVGAILGLATALGWATGLAVGGGRRLELADLFLAAFVAGVFGYIAGVDRA